MCMTHANNPQHDTQLHAMLLYLIEKVEALSSPPEDANRIYDNKALMALLGIKDRYLKRLRDNGLLGYSRHGDKYWYTQADVDNFLARCHCAPFGR
ncbi:MAG: helix-turn-helix domain-containing protein [Muribaculaceae bacterium]|nr:helix-turn-helix domain-containing protein [Muribaculaceae bacterium]